MLTSAPLFSSTFITSRCLCSAAQMIGVQPPLSWKQPIWKKCNHIQINHWPITKQHADQMIINQKPDSQRKFRSNKWLHFIISWHNLIYVFVALNLTKIYEQVQNLNKNNWTVLFNGLYQKKMHLSLPVHWHQLVPFPEAYSLFLGFPISLHDGDQCIHPPPRDPGEIIEFNNGQTPVSHCGLK